MCSHVVGEIIFLLFIWIEAFYLVTLEPQIGVFILMIMRKLLLLFIFIMGGVFANSASAAQITMHIVKDGAAGSGATYAPPRPWYITQDDYVFTLPAFEDDFTLELRDEDDAVVYSTLVPVGTTQVVLPSTLSGDFELRLAADIYYYRGYISF